MNVRLIMVSMVFLSCIHTSMVWACHKGGAQGFASQDPIASTTDYTSVGIFSFASTSGTSGCENWDFIQVNQQQYIAANWEYLSEDAAQGKGNYLTAFAQIMGCSQNAEQRFNTIMHSNYRELFHLSYPSEYEKAHQFLSTLKGMLATESFVCQPS